MAGLFAYCREEVEIINDLHRGVVLLISPHIDLILRYSPVTQFFV